MNINKVFLKSFAASIILAATMSNCTNLEENLLTGRVAAKDGEAATASLASVYNQLAGFPNHENMRAMQEHPSDEMMGPTRGTDWDDFGTWRKLHQHTWDATHNQILNAWNTFNIGAYRGTLVLADTKTTPAEKAEARFLRAFFMYYLVDAYGQVPFKEANDAGNADPKVLSRKEAIEFIITDLEKAIPELSPLTNRGKASREAANVLLAKLYLNKAVYVQDPASPSGPFTFNKADMDKVVAACDVVMSSNKFSLQPAGKWFQNFYWDNGSDSKEIIFSIINTDANRPANVWNMVNMSLHYNLGGHDQPNGGAWNGFTTLADFYNSFEPTDERLGGDVKGYTEKVGLKFGFLKGQQLNWDGTKVLERGGSPLIFTDKVNLQYAGESEGIRVNKFISKPGAPALKGFPFSTDGGNSNNDNILFRYADVVLIKAEAILRGGTATRGDTKESLVNSIRTLRGLKALSAVDDKALLAERAHELYWEGWRRQDQIRFGTFLTPVDQRSTASAPSKVLFPIPLQAVTSNVNLKQNPGY